MSKYILWQGKIRFLPYHFLRCMELDNAGIFCFILKQSVLGLTLVCIRNQKTQRRGVSEGWKELGGCLVEEGF